MFKKHFTAIADIIRTAKQRRINSTSIDVIKYIEEELADYFATENSNFNRERFKAACK